MQDLPHLRLGLPASRPVENKCLLFPQAQETERLRKASALTACAFSHRDWGVGEWGVRGGVFQGVSGSHCQAWALCSLGAVTPAKAQRCRPAGVSDFITGPSPPAL